MGLKADDLSADDNSNDLSVTFNLLALYGQARRHLLECRSPSRPKVSRYHRALGQSHGPQKGPDWVWKGQRRRNRNGPRPCLFCGFHSREETSTSLTLPLDFLQSKINQEQAI